MALHTDHRKSEIEVLNNLGYKLGRKLGEGAFAMVFLAERGTESASVKHKNKLACKIMDLSRAPEEILQTFLPRELDILMELHHPHIVHVHSIWQRGTKIFVFMGLAGRGHLGEYLRRNGAVSEYKARIWLRQMALAVQYLHEMDICHRDLKCENVLISDKYNVKLADFGLSRRTVDAKGRPVLSETYCGSLPYEPPEVLMCKPYNPKLSDVWALGVILFAILNKAMPFDIHRPMVEHQINRHWKFRSKVADSLSDNVKRLTAAMLEPDTSKRISIDQVVKSDFIAMKPELVPLSPDEKQALMRAKAWKRKIRAEGRSSEFDLFGGKGLVTGEEATKAAIANVPKMNVLQKLAK